MPDFEAELYLRLMGERTLLARGDQTRGAGRPAIAEAAMALIAIGAIESDCAESLLDEYRFAATLRQDPQLRRYGVLGATLRPDPSETKALKPRRVVPCAHTIEQSKARLHVRYVSLSEEATAVAVTWYPDASNPRSGGPPQASLTDDRGTTEAARFEGGGSTYGMHGRLTTARPLAPDTSWIELDGTRLELTAHASSFEVTSERLPEQDPAHRYLWQRLAEPKDFEEDVEPAIAALVAAGAVSGDDPLLAEVRAVLEAMRPVANHPSGSPPGPNGVPEPWQSLLARSGSDDGPSGAIVLGAVPPAFDDFSVAVLELESGPSRFTVDVEVAPAVGRRMPYDWGVGRRQLAWWARDDRGSHYLGHRGNWSYSSDFGHGLIDFRPALDPQAARLELMPTGQTTRAVISFSLPWTA